MLPRNLHCTLAPSARIFTRSLSTAKKPLASDVYTSFTPNTSAAVTSTPTISAAQRESLDSSLRINQAGEIAANAIYQGQHLVFRRDKELGPLIKDMWDAEKKHLEVMNKLQVQHRIRPTILAEVAKIGGLGLGVVTALMGKEAAMACTEAVETVIGEHYDDQLKDMASLPNDHPSIPLLREVIEEFRDDELEHLDMAVENHSQRAPAHALLSSVVGTGCKIAIELCRRV